MKQADGVEMQAAPRDRRLKDDETPGYQHKDLRILNPMPEQSTRALLRGGTSAPGGQAARTRRVSAAGPWTIRPRSHLPAFVNSISPHASNLFIS